MTGMGGTGKTRLAIEVANSVGGAFPDGVYFVPLADATEADAAVATIGQVLDLPAEERSLAGLGTRLSVLDAFVVLDNLEQLADADALVSRLVADAPAAVVLVTSRRPLRVAGEHAYPLGTLSVPLTTSVDDVRRSAAAELFLERAEMAGARLVLDRGTADLVARIVWRLEGLPLALEIAAARTTLLSTSALLQGLDDMLELTDPGVDRAERHRSLHSTIAWSYNLVDDPAQALLRRLSVHAGATFDALVSTWGDPGSRTSVADALSTLVDSALVTSDLAAAEGPRFTMATAVRAFALDALSSSGDEDEAQPPTPRTTSTWPRRRRRPSGGEGPSSPSPCSG